MKENFALIVAAALLLAVVAFVAVNNVFVSRTVAKLSNLLEELPDSPDPTADKEIKEFQAIMEKKGKWLTLSVSYEHVSNTNIAAAELMAYSIARDEAGYLSALGRLKKSVEVLGRNEKFSMENII